MSDPNLPVTVADAPVPTPGDKPSEAMGLPGRLVAWFRREKRPLPWRGTRDPYRIWVSEVMLQQTSVGTVIPYYGKFLEKFPTLGDLARAEAGEALKAWEGMGYYARIRNLHAAAREVMIRHGGKLPADAAALRALPGVGEYMAGALLSLAFGKAVPAVDGNVLRVMARLFAIGDDVREPATRAGISERVALLIPPKHPGEFNQALMELGETRCTPRGPLCLLCPIAAFCEARKQGRVGKFPVRGKSPRAPVKPVVQAFFRKGKQVLLVKRPVTGLLAGMWEFPGGEAREGERDATALRRILRKDFGMTAEVGEPIASRRHAFSHVVWEIRVYECKASRDSRKNQDGHSSAIHESRVAIREMRWVPPETLVALPITTATRRIMAELDGTKGENR
ncbi:MAG: A/G-specific adenine glycosylase [Planctomycetota bacterium]